MRYCSAITGGEKIYYSVNSVFIIASLHKRKSAINVNCQVSKLKKIRPGHFPQVGSSVYVSIVEFSRNRQAVSCVVTRDSCLDIHPFLRLMNELPLKVPRK